MGIFSCHVGLPEAIAIDDTGRLSHWFSGVPRSTPTDSTPTCNLEDLGRFFGLPLSLHI